MAKKRVLSLLLTLILLIGLLPQNIFAQNQTEKELASREVYLHAFDEQREISDTTNNRTVYVDDPTNLYLAVDDPNKARREEEPQFDMTGYTVKIYFDTKYFEFPAESENMPIDYRYPNNLEGWDNDDILGDDAGDKEDIIKPGYFAWRHEESDAEGSRGYAAITVFLLSDGADNAYSKFPEGVDSEKYWYNLLKLPLIPKRTGYTSVYLDFDTSDEYTLELFAKNNTPDDALNFDCALVNDGTFYITIDEKNKPKAPRPDDDHPAGTYNEEINIGLWHENAEPCEIYYSIDGTDPKNTTHPSVLEFNDGDQLSLSSKTTIKTAALRTSDGKWSDVKEYTYDFLPRAPYLFNSQGKLIPNVYNEIWKEGGYYVSASDNQDFSKGITDGCKVYYTFKPDLAVDELDKATDGTDAETQWVEAKFNGTIDGFIADKITKERVMRLVTVNKWGKSDVAVYYLGVKPDVVKTNPGSGLDRAQPITLSCDTPDAKIYYTLNGGDPRDGGELYTGPITLSVDTVVKAVAFYEGKWGDVTSFWYLFSNISGVTAYSPSGTYEGSVNVTLYPNEPGKAIKISYDNGITWTDYNGETMPIKEYTRFRAKTADDNGLGDEFVYIIKPLPPVFSPESAQFTSADTVTVFCPESNPDTEDEFELWYTTDGSEPTEEDKADGDSVNIKITEYTTIKAVVVKNGEYKSDIVTHTYGVVYGKPAKPLTTLLSGFYTREIGSDKITTQFKEVPEGTEIYYTISTGDDPGSAPDLNKVGEGTYKYNDEEIEVIDSMIINAVAVRIINGEVVKSDLATFNYLVSPEEPVAAPSANVNELPVVPVDVVTVSSESGNRSKVKYTIGNETDGYFTAEFVTDYPESADPADYSRFYIDTKTGNAYKNADLSGEPLFVLDKTFTDTVVLVLSSELDGVSSGEKAYIYSVDTENMPLIPPYADKVSGTYSESKDSFVVTLNSVYSDSDNVKIQWKYIEDDTWTDYSAEKPEFETKDKILYIRTVDMTDTSRTSQSVGYVYYFVPPAPTIIPVSGVYEDSDNEKITIKQSEDKMIGADYRLHYCQSTDDRWDWTREESYPYYEIDATKTIKAYVENVTTGRISEVVYASYILEDDDVLGAAVTINSPFDKKRISAHLLGKDEYAKGVIFNPKSGVIYNYAYNFTPEAGGGSFASGDIEFLEENAFVPTMRMDNVTINAWIDGAKSTTYRNHEIDIVHLSVPTVKLSDTPDSNGDYAKDTKYWVENIYPLDENIIVYYTLDGSDPTQSAKRTKFTKAALGGEEKLSQTTTVKAVYFSACGGCDRCENGDKENCKNGVYGEIGTYKFTVPTVKYTAGGGGGGGSVIVDKTRKYTKDIFGNEHPSHIGYIKGYPDGSVQPDGHITREEIAAILYRITNHEYEEPFAVTGEVFPDVASTRWSVKEIEYMADDEVVLGYPDGEFKPVRNLTRAEFAALICRFAELEETDGENVFSDLSEDHWAYKNVFSLYEAGLLDGYPDGTFRAENQITRAEVMTVINKLLGRNPLEAYVKSLNYNPFNDLYIDKWYYVIVLEATITHNYYLDDEKFEIKWEDCK